MPKHQRAPHLQSDTEQGGTLHGLGSPRAKHIPRPVWDGEQTQRLTRGNMAENARYSTWHRGQMYEAVLPVLIFSIVVPQRGQGFPSR